MPVVGVARKDTFRKTVPLLVCRATPYSWPPQSLEVVIDVGGRGIMHQTVMQKLYSGAPWSLGSAIGVDAQGIMHQTAMQELVQEDIHSLILILTLTTEPPVAQYSGGWLAYDCEDIPLRSSVLVRPYGAALPVQGPPLRAAPPLRVLPTPHS